MPESTAFANLIPQPGRPSLLPRRRILLIDDQRDIVDTQAMLFEILGQDVCRAYDAADGLTAAASFRPDLVLLDLRMPLIGGLEVARRLRALPQLAETLIVAHTATEGPGLSDTLIACGFDACLRKPATLAELVGMLRERDLSQTATDI